MGVRWQGITRKSSFYRVVSDLPEEERQATLQRLEGNGASKRENRLSMRTLDDLGSFRPTVINAASFEEGAEVPQYAETDVSAANGNGGPARYCTMQPGQARENPAYESAGPVQVRENVAYESMDHPTFSHRTGSHSSELYDPPSFTRPGHSEDANATYDTPIFLPSRSAYDTPVFLPSGVVQRDNVAYESYDAPSFEARRPPLVKTASNQSEPGFLLGAPVPRVDDAGYTVGAASPGVPAFVVGPPMTASCRRAVCGERRWFLPSAIRPNLYAWWQTTFTKTLPLAICTLSERGWCFWDEGLVGGDMGWCVCVCVCCSGCPPRWRMPLAPQARATPCAQAGPEVGVRRSRR